MFDFSNVTRSNPKRCRTAWPALLLTWGCCRLVACLAFALHVGDETFNRHENIESVTRQILFQECFVFQQHTTALFTKHCLWTRKQETNKVVWGLCKRTPHVLGTAQHGNTKRTSRHHRSERTKNKMLGSRLDVCKDGETRKTTGRTKIIHTNNVSADQAETHICSGEWKTPGVEWATRPSEKPNKTHSETVLCETIPIKQEGNGFGFVEAGT